VLLFGLLSFIFQMSSRREANVQALFPWGVAELVSWVRITPLSRVLEKLDIDALPSSHLELIKYFMRSKKFTNQPLFTIRESSNLGRDARILKRRLEFRVSPGFQDRPRKPCRLPVAFFLLPCALKWSMQRSRVRCQTPQRHYLAIPVKGLFGQMRFWIPHQWSLALETPVFLRRLTFSRHLVRSSNVLFRQISHARVLSHFFMSGKVFSILSAHHQK
jgi:hypothetical protein